MAVFTPPFVLPVMAAISSRESPVARNCSNRLVPAGSRSRVLLAILSISDCSICEEASRPSESHSGYTPLLTGPFLRQSEMQLFFVVDTAQASALRICTPSRLATQSRSSTSCTTSSGSPSNREARKNVRAVARTLGLISVSSISSVFSILHRYRRNNRKKSRKIPTFFESTFEALEANRPFTEEVCTAILRSKAYLLPMSGMCTLSRFDEKIAEGIEGVRLMARASPHILLVPKTYGSGFELFQPCHCGCACKSEP